MPPRDLNRRNDMPYLILLSAPIIEVYLRDSLFSDLVPGPTPAQQQAFLGQLNEYLVNAKYIVGENMDSGKTVIVNVERISLIEEITQETYDEIQKNKKLARQAVLDKARNTGIEIPSPLRVVKIKPE
jgi:hypothetical protein